MMLGAYLGGALATFAGTLVQLRSSTGRWCWNTAALWGVLWFVFVPLDLWAETRGPRDG